MDAITLKRFLTFQFDWETFSSPLIEVSKVSPDIFRQPASAFQENLQAVVSSISLPAQLIVRLHQSLKTKLGALSSEQITDEIMDDGFFQAATELLRQGTVLTWAALEVFSTDAFLQLLNLVPDLSVNLLDDERVSKRFQLRNVPVKTVHDFGYDLSKKMGLLFIQRQPISGTEVMRDVFDVLCPESERLRTLLLQDRLWLLNQRRNLIVHKRAVVDKFYLSATGDNLELGSTLKIDVSDIERDLHLVRDVGIELLRALPARLKIISAQSP